MSETLNLIPLSKKFINDNPSLNCGNLLELLPTIAQQLRDCIIEFNQQDFPVLNKKELSDNTTLPTTIVIEKAKESLISVLKELTYMLNIFPEDNMAYPIQLIVDKCYTNNCIHATLYKILGHYMPNFVETLNWDLSKPLDNKYFKNKLHNNSIIIIGGSYEDPYALHENFYHSYLISHLKKVMSEFGNGEVNNRLIGVCFGQQLMSILFGHTLLEDEKVITTIKGPAQFSPSKCRILPGTNRAGIYRKVLYGLKGNGDGIFTVPFTRTGFVIFDLLKRGGKEPVIPLIEDYMTNGIVGWGTPNGKALGVQFHPELSLTNKSMIDLICSELRGSEIFLKDSYLDNGHTIESMIENFSLQINGEQILKRGDLGESFYTFAILTFARDMLRNIKEKMNKKHIIENLNYDIIPYEEIMKSIMHQVQNQINRQMLYSKRGSLNNTLISSRPPIQILEHLDIAGLLKLPPRPDWKVSRGINEVSETIGIKDLTILIKKHKDWIEKNNLKRGYYIFRDRGAGDGTLLKSLYNNLFNENVIFYGVGDYIYGDLFSFLKNEFPQPEYDEIIKLIIQKTFIKMNYTQDRTLFDTFTEAINNIYIKSTDYIKQTSYTSTGKTLMFDEKVGKPLSTETQEYINANGPEIVNHIKEFLCIKENFYRMYKGYFERIIPSHFAGFNVDDPKISHVDFQIAIRSTSHVNSNELKAILESYVNNSAKPGSIFIENGVHRSYTYSPRIKELYDVEKKYNGIIKIYLIFDYSSNYFSGAVILNSPFYPIEEIKKEFKEGYTLVDVTQAYRSFFFRFERFLRSFIITNFKNFDIFWDFNSQIMDIIYFSYKIFKNEKDVSKMEKSINEKITMLINFLVNKFNEKNNTKYNLIKQSDFEFYKSPEGDRIKDLITFLDNSDEEWINPKGKRNY